MFAVVRVVRMLSVASHFHKPSPIAHSFHTQYFVVAQTTCKDPLISISFQAITFATYALKPFYVDVEPPPYTMEALAILLVG